LASSTNSRSVLGLLMRSSQRENSLSTNLVTNVVRVSSRAVSVEVVIHVLLAIRVRPVIRVLRAIHAPLAAAKVPASLGAAVAGVVNFAGDDLPIPEALHRTSKAC
jgi:hypothetical protein